jgi:predicted ATPase/DNA-binding SARP family transcriptional activator/tetratricopeptide (TPR) repeat protein
MEMAKQSVRLLGAAHVVWETGTPPRFRSKRTVALLGYLVAERRRFTRDSLAALFWPEELLTTGRANLRRELHNLANLVPGCWQVDHNTVAFTSGGGTNVDLDMLRRLEAEGQWAEAAEYARGEFLEGLYPDENLELESWLLGERERWRQRTEQVLLRAAQSEEQQGNYRQARHYLSRLLKLIPWHEESHRRMMALLAHSGQFSAALRQYELCRAMLAEELAVTPSLATTTLYERIKMAMALPPHNLPLQATPFIGRKGEVASLKQRLAGPDCRLLTLTGVGGIGKSRLALEVARALATDDRRLFLHGVVFVPLVGVDAQDLIAAIGAGLGLAFSGQQPAEQQLLTYLRDMELLLLLDNYDHLLPDTTLLATILQEAPAVKLLVTSRERLHVHEEWLFEVGGLPYPRQEHMALGERDESHYDAVRLFAAKARRVQRTFSLATAGPEVAAICRLVQGLPLALELSAARLNSLTPADVLAELESGLDILAVETQNGSPRHASLRAAFDVSWSALSAQEQEVLSQLSLFRGGFMRDAAEAVTGATVPLLSSLGDKSLIRLLPSGRYESHELLRQYAAEKLAAEPGVAVTTQARYAAYYGAFLREREQRLLETDQEETLRELEREMDNLRPAWRWLVQHEKVEVLDAALWTMAAYYLLRGQTLEGLALAEEALARLTRLEEEGIAGQRLHARLRLFQAFFIYSTGRMLEARHLLTDALDQLRIVGDSKDLGWALFALGQITWELAESFLSTYGNAGMEVRQHGVASHLRDGIAAVRPSGPRWLEGFIATRLANILGLDEDRESLGEAEQLVRRAVAIGQQLENPFVLGSARLTEGFLAAHRGEYQRTEEAYEQALAAVQRIDHLWFKGMVRMVWGHVTYLQGEFARARQHYFESVMFFRRMGARRWEATLLNLLGDIARAEDNIDQAQEQYQACMDLYQELGNLNPTHWVACNLGHALLRQRRLESAADSFRYALAGLNDSRDRALAGMTLTGVAGILAARGQPELGVRLAGAARVYFATLPHPLDPANQQDSERIVAQIKEWVDAETFAANWEAGRTLAVDEAVALALAGLTPVAQEP